MLSEACPGCFYNFAVIKQYVGKDYYKQVAEYYIRMGHQVLRHPYGIFLEIARGIQQQQTQGKIRRFKPCRHICRYDEKRVEKAPCKRAVQAAGIKYQEQHACDFHKQQQVEPGLNQDAYFVQVIKRNAEIITHRVRNIMEGMP